jgi:hypothetical protein
MQTQGHRPDRVQPPAGGKRLTLKGYRRTFAAGAEVLRDGGGRLLRGASAR